MHRYWFKPKRHGIGAIPATWEGWGLAGLAILAILAEGRLIPPRLVDPQSGHAAALLAQAATAAMTTAPAFLIPELHRPVAEGGHGMPLAEAGLVSSAAMAGMMATLRYAV